MAGDMRGVDPREIIPSRMEGGHMHAVLDRLGMRAVKREKRFMCRRVVGTGAV
jgi:hypothetical protein